MLRSRAKSEDDLFMQGNDSGTVVGQWFPDTPTSLGPPPSTQHVLLQMCAFDLIFKWKSMKTDCQGESHVKVTSFSSLFRPLKLNVVISTMYQLLNFKIMT